MKKLCSVAAIALGAICVIGAPSGVRADMYTISDCSNGLGCGTGNNFGTVTTTNISGGVEVSVSLNSGVYFFGNFDPSVMFALSGIASITYGGTYTGFTPAPGGTQTASSLHPDGIGTFNYGLFWTAGSGAPNADPDQTLVFDVLASGLTTSNFIPGTNSPTGNPLYFAFDIGIGCSTEASGKLNCVNTGFSGATAAVPGPVLGAGLPGLFAACAGLWGLARRRRRNLA